MTRGGSGSLPIRRSRSGSEVVLQHMLRDNLSNLPK
jgi:hypothetical protein